MSTDAADNPPDPELVRVLCDRLDRFERHATGHLLGWIQATELSPAEIRIFLALDDGRPRPAAELAKTTDVPVELAYPALHKLAARGWLAETHRMHCLSPEGKEKLQELAGVRRSGVEDFVSSLAPEESRTLATALGVVDSIVDP